VNVRFKLKFNFFRKKIQKKDKAQSKEKTLSMCGITGFVTFDQTQTKDVVISSGKKMADTLIHRGPDDSGIWVDEKEGICLAHRRLSIIDLSECGHQPMISQSGRFVITYNGEIYNHPEIRRELEKTNYSFRGHSDTEVMLAAIETWGLFESLKKFIGMFALALWDQKEKQLFLARDRMGKKPLYYGFTGNCFLFGSELKALKAHPEFQSEISRNALTSFLRLSYVPTPDSIYKDVHKLTPGTILTLNPRRQWNEVKVTPYWSFYDFAGKKSSRICSQSEPEIMKELELLLRDAVKIRMYSDVPLGVFLSGGIDSSLITALMQTQSEIPVKTFTIGFHELNYNEAQYAKKVANHLGTQHTELYLTPKNAMEVIPFLSTLYDEPFADPSQIPTYLVSKMAKQQVTVALSGDGGDEIFGGYNRYLIALNWWKKISRISAPMRKLLTKTIFSISPQKIDAVLAPFSKFNFPFLKEERKGEKLHKLAKILDVSTCEEMYFQFISHCQDPKTIVTNGIEPTDYLQTFQWDSTLSCAEKMMAYDALSYLPDDILAKVDRASMGVSLEVRAPILDHRIVEYAWGIPIELKIHRGKTKWILRKILYQFVPMQLVERPKMGFGLPIGEWLRGPLREWTESLINEQKLKNENFFNPQPIREKWEEHLSGKRNHYDFLWNILMFESWLQNEKPSL
jgi:asparagine synthase (glutamine-hydrolysing)